MSSLALLVAVPISPQVTVLFQCGR
uniref:Uncharacterized protein n=1 Tax=Anguilla anguilla TaxID=7936 RepID=A0A0E9U8U2_ANGAN